MEITIPFIRQRFERFNKLCFDGSLHQLPITLTHARTYCGQFTYKVRANSQGKKELYDKAFRFAAGKDLDETDWEDIIIHEMIHYYLAVNNMEDKTSHGPNFRGMMNSINAKYGRHITISHKDTKGIVIPPHKPIGRWHAIADVTFNDGTVGFKVLPRIKQRIIYYYTNVMRSPTVKSVRFYFSRNLYFEGYPNSTALKVHPIEREILDELLKDALPIHCDGKTASY